MKKAISLLALITVLVALVSAPVNAQNTDYPMYDGYENYDKVYNSIDFMDISNHWANNSIYKMGALSIMKSKGETHFSPQKPVTRLEALTLIIRLMGLEKEALEKSMGNELEGYIKVATGEKVLLDEDLNKIGDSWQVPIERQMMAAWIGRMLKLKENYGLDQKLVKTMNDWKKIDPEYLPTIDSIIKSNIMNGDSKKNFNPKVSVKKGELVKILDNVHERILKEQGYKVETGKITDKTYVTEGNVAKNVLLVQKDDQSFEGLGFNNRYGFIVYKNGSIGYPQTLSKGDYIRYYLDTNNNVTYVEVIKKEEKTVSGRIQDIDVENRSISIRDNASMTHIYQVTPNASINTNGIHIKIEELLYDQDVKLRVLNGKVMDIDGYLDEGDDGYIHPGERVNIGKALYIDKNSGKLVTQENGQQKEYLINPFIPVIKNNGNVGIDSIREGDLVRLEFDQYQGNSPMKVYILNPDRQVTDIYQGNISYYNNSKNQIILKNIKKYNHTMWDSEYESVAIDLNKTTPIYVNGKAITKELLKNYIDRDAYIAMGNNLGKQEAIKIVLKNGYEQNYQNTLQSIRFGDRNLTIDYNNIYYDEGTIIVKDGRLVDPYNLKESDELYVSSHGMGNSYTASIISIEGTSNYKNSDYTVYKGNIEYVYNRNLDLIDSVVTDGVDEYKKKRTSVALNNDTKIKDARGLETKEISINELLNDGLLDKDSKYRDELVYVIAKDGIAQAITIIEEHQKHYAISLADISSIDRLGQVMTIKNARDWRGLGNRWTINNSTMKLYIEDSIIIKNGKAVTINELRGNENVYIMRGNNDGYIIICR